MVSAGPCPTLGPGHPLHSGTVGHQPGLRAARPHGRHLPGQARERTGRPADDDAVGGRAHEPDRVEKDVEPGGGEAKTALGRRRSAKVRPPRGSVRPAACPFGHHRGRHGGDEEELDDLLLARATLAASRLRPGTGTLRRQGEGGSVRHPAMAGRKPASDGDEPPHGRFGGEAPRSRDGVEAVASQLRLGDVVRPVVPGLIPATHGGPERYRPPAQTGRLPPEFGTGRARGNRDRQHAVTMPWADGPAGRRRLSATDRFGQAMGEAAAGLPAVRSPLPATWLAGADGVSPRNMIRSALGRLRTPCVAVLDVLVHRGEHVKCA